MEKNPKTFIQSPVDLNKPVVNPALVAAIASVSQNPSSSVQQELRHQLNHANYLVAVNNDELDVKAGPVEGQAKITGLIKVLTCSDDSGRDLLPIFTDWGEIEAYTSQKMATLVMPSSELWPFVLDGSYEGIVVNPGRTSIFLSLGQIKELQSLSRQSDVPTHSDLEKYVGRSRRVRSYHRMFSIFLILVSCYFYRASALGPCVAFGIPAMISIVLEFIPFGREPKKPSP